MKLVQRRSSLRSSGIGDPLALCGNGIESEKRVRRIRLDRPAWIGRNGALESIGIRDRHEPTLAQVEPFPRPWCWRDRSLPRIGEGRPVVCERDVPEDCSRPLEFEHWLIGACLQISHHDRLGVAAADGQEAAVRTERQGTHEVPGGHDHVGRTTIRHASDGDVALGAGELTRIGRIFQDAGRQVACRPDCSSRASTARFWFISSGFR